MKNKAVSHKSQNTFKFKSISERIANINIDVIHHIETRSDVPEESDTFFYECLKKWNELNYSKNYDEFKEELGNDIITLNQLILKEKEVILCLQKHLTIEGTLALQALLELVVALARDLQLDFYNHFPSLFKTITSLLNTNDPEQLEWIFVCLTYLLKFLRRSMVRDIDNVFLLYLSLLSNKKEYIRNFAAESFGFLIRKVPDKDKLFDFMFLQLEQNKQHAIGIGQLLFEVIKGVQKQLHNCSEKILPILFEKLGDSQGERGTILPYDAIMIAQIQMAKSVAAYVDRDHVKVLWRILFEFMKKLILRLQDKENDERFQERIEQHLHQFFQIFEVFMMFKNGIFIIKPEEIHETFILILKTKMLSSQCGALLLRLIASFITSQRNDMEMFKICQLVQLVFESNYSFELIFSFTSDMFSYNMFEKDVLPHLLKYCSRILQDRDKDSITAVLCMLVKTVNNFSAYPKMGEDLIGWKRFRLDFPVQNRDKADQFLLVNFIKAQLKEFSEMNAMENLSSLWSLLVVLPHLRPLDVDQFIPILENIFIKNLQLLNAEPSISDEYQYILYCVVVTLILLSDPMKACEIFSEKVVLDILRCSPHSISFLRITDMIIKTASKHSWENFLSDTLFHSIFALIEKNLASPYHEIRLLTLEILSSFDLSGFSIETKETNIFKICLTAEKIEPQISTYREKLKWLQKLEFDAIQNHVGGIFKTVPLQYLLGALYVNFNLLWQPITRFIETHAKCLSLNEFWEVYKSNLHDVAAKIENSASVHCREKKPKCALSSELSKLFSESSTFNSENADYENHRFLLWSTMAKFADLVEPKNRDISPLFLQYIENEYYPVDSTAAPTQDISNKAQNELNLHGDVDMLDDTMENTFETNIQNDNETIEDSMIENEELESINGDNEEELLNDDNEDNEVDSINDDDDKEITECDINIEDENDFEDNFEMNLSPEIANETKRADTIKKQTPMSCRKQKNKTSKKRGYAKSLCSHLKVFSKFRNPKALFKEAQLKDLYWNFLSNRNPEVQKLALDCLFAYADKNLTPYKENMYNLLEDKTFKNELTSFNIDVQNKIIQEEHRSSVLPVLMRILYGKMLYRTGRNTSGKSNTAVRQSIILRFLAGSQEEELYTFLNLAFQSFEILMKDNSLHTVQHITQSFDLKLMVPLKKIQGSLNLLNVVFNKLGNLMSTYLPWLLKLILCITTLVSEALERRSEIAFYYLNPLKNLRTLAMLRLVQFFKVFDTYSFTAEEIDAIFKAAIWPQLGRLHFESVYSPTPLLKLFCLWSANPRYYVLFTKYFEDNVNFSPLPHILKLFTNEKLRPSVNKAILELLENLLTLADFNEQSEENEAEDDTVAKTTPLIVNNCLSHPEKFSDTDSLNMGTQLLMPHVTLILDQLKKIVQKCSKSPRKILPERILNILIRLSEYVVDPHQSQELVALLLPFLLQAKHQSENRETGVIKTMNNLLKFSEAPQKFVRKVAELFGHLSNRNSRVLLCEMMMVIASRDANLHSAAELVSKMNAWDARRVDQPDFNIRLDAFHSAAKIIQECSIINVDFVFLAIFNSSYYIRTADDLSMRESSSHLLKSVIQNLDSLMKTHEDEANMILFSGLLPEIKKGLRSKNEVTLSEFIYILGILVKYCPNIPKLNNLLVLTDEDLEVDFFENIRHIQMHRKARAMTRLARSEFLIKIHEDIILQYMMPITTSFFFNENLAKYPNVVDAAIELLGSICGILRWHHYEKFLRYYLNMLPKNMENQKTVIKIVVAILDAFHFDLSGVIEQCTLVEPPSISNKNVNENNKEENEEEEMEVENDLPKVQLVDSDSKVSTEILTKQSINKIFQSINKGILPSLHKCLTHKTKSEGEHKLNRTTFPEDEEILRIPIALAMIKLLQKLPKETLERNLPGLFLKLCALLKSRVESIRVATRDVIVKIMLALGPRYFPYLLKQMRQTMTKGYQVHVMIFTLNAILMGFNDKFTAGDLDGCLKSLTEVCHEELCGQVSEEKEVVQITGKLKEARGNKSQNIYKILAQFISDVNILPLITSLKEILSSTQKHQIVNKCQECLYNVVMGLMENSSVTAKTLLISCYGIVNESIPQLAGIKKISEERTIPTHLIRPDSYLIAPEPARGGGKSKTSIKTNAHVLVNFGLQLLYHSIKRNKIVANDKENLQMLDPFIPCLTQCLNSQHVKLITSATRCLTWLFKLHLPSLKSHINRINSALFILLNKYAGSTQGENVEMVHVCFQAVTSLIREIDYHIISEEQLQVLLTYVEQDILDSAKQAAAFSLLKTILSRKLIAQELHDLMKKIAEMSITSELEPIRVQCRQAFLQYLLDYPLGKTVNSHFDFYLAQLDFEHEYGRKSALEFMTAVINLFPERYLAGLSGRFFSSISIRLVNDSSIECRKMIAHCLKTFLKKLNPEDQDTLFSAVLEWLKDSKMLYHQRLAAQLCGIFVDVQESSFEKHLKKLLPTIIKLLGPKAVSNVKNEEQEKENDRLIYFLLNSVKKIFQACDLIKSVAYQKQLKKLWECCHQLLLHPHTWVRLVACQIFEMFLAAYPADVICAGQKKDLTSLINTEDKLHNLAQNFVSQMQAPELQPELAEQIVKNLVYLCKICCFLKRKDDESLLSAGDHELEEGKNDFKFIDWMINKLNREVTFEVANNPKITIKRLSIFKWLAAVSLELGTEGLTSLRLQRVLMSLHRELNDLSIHSDADLKNLATEILELVKKIVGVERFTKEYAALQTKMFGKRSERKAKKAQLAVSNPEVAARKRIKKQMSKKDAKRRRIEKLRPTKPSKKRKLKDMAIT